MERIQDSKAIKSDQEMNDIADIIKENAIEWKIAWRDEKVVDNKKISEVVYDCWHECLDNLKTPFNSILVDGKYFRKYQDIKHQTIIKGDGQYLSIAGIIIITTVEIY